MTRYTVTGKRWVWERFIVDIEAQDADEARRLTRLAARADVPYVVFGLIKFQVIERLDVERITTGKVEENT